MNIGDFFFFFFYVNEADLKMFILIFCRRDDARIRINALSCLQTIAKVLIVLVHMQFVVSVTHHTIHNLPFLRSDLPACPLSSLDQVYSRHTDHCILFTHYPHSAAALAFHHLDTRSCLYRACCSMQRTYGDS